MADEAVFTTYNITDEQDVTPEIRKKAADFYDQAFQYNWEQDNKTEWITANGAPMDKPADLTDWQFSGAGAGMGNFGTIPRYADLNNLLDEQRTFFANASDEDIRKALKPPNDMGKFAQKAYADMLKEKNYQDNLFTQGQLPDTDVRKANEIIQEKESELKLDAQTDNEFEKETLLKTKIDKRSGSTPPKTLKEIEKNAIVDALSFTEWNMSKAAKVLGVSRMTLYRKIDSYGIQENE